MRPYHYPQVNNQESASRFNIFYWPEAKKRSLAQAKNALFAFASLDNKSFLPLRAVSALEIQP